MSPRRSKKNRDLPPNLYVYQGYYKYKHPITKKYHGLGTDKQKAILATNQLNCRLIGANNVVDNILGNNTVTMDQVCNEFQKKVNSNPRLAESTKTEKGYRITRIKNDLQNVPVKSIDTPAIVSYLDAFNGDSYKQHRSILNQLFNYAETRGYIERGLNPVTPTESSDVTHEKKRQRLTLKQFNAIYEIAPDWFQCAMELSLLTLQAREEVSSMRYDHIDNDVLFVIRKKTQKHDASHIAITQTSQLKTLISRTRKLAPVSPFIIHRKAIRQRAEKAHWSQVLPDMITREFKKLRDSLPEFEMMDKKERPTFHEIRSLGGHLMKKAGVPKEHIQALMGHSKIEMTKHYLDGHEINWSLALASEVDFRVINVR